MPDNLSIQLAPHPAAEGAVRQEAFWTRWVLANAVGELAGLGTVALIAWALVSALKDQQSLLQHILFASALITAGALEGVVVGAAQAWVLTSRLAGLPRWEWIQATFLGSLLAWVLGMLPSTLMSAMAEGSGQAPPEPSPAMIYALAALLGAVAGLILSFFQWRVLRRHLPGALGWLAANAAAWALGMPLVFLGADLATRGGAIPLLLGRCAATLAGTGAVVGAVHGLWLVWNLRRQSPGHVGGSEDQGPTRNVQRFCRRSAAILLEELPQPPLPPTAVLPGKPAQALCPGCHRCGRCTDMGCFSEALFTGTGM